MLSYLFMYLYSIFTAYCIVFLVISSLFIKINSSFSAETTSSNTSVTYDFESGTIEGWNAERISSPWSAIIVSDIVRKGRYAARFEVRDGDFIRDGRRAELKDNYYAEIGSDVWYSFSSYVPQDIPIEEGHCVFVQWHGTADNDIEKNASRSPPLAHRSSNGTFYVTLRYSKEKTQSENNGTELILYNVPNFPKGVWHDFIYHIKWSYKDDGFVKMWHNKKFVIDYIGSVGYNDSQGVYLKIGMYRNDSNKTYVIYHDEYSRSNEFNKLKLP